MFTRTAHCIAGGRLYFALMLHNSISQDTNESGPVIEPDLQSHFKNCLQDAFMILDEVPGVHLLEESSVRVDFLCHARPWLIERGFPVGWFVVETKHIDFFQHESKRLYESFWQAVTYTQCRFRVNEDWVTPRFSALYINKNPSTKNYAPAAAQARRWAILTELGVYSNVGIFRLTDSLNWSLWFGQGRLFDITSGLGNVPRGLKKYVGNGRSSRNAFRPETPN